MSWWTKNRKKVGIGAGLAALYASGIGAPAAAALTGLLGSSLAGAAGAGTAGAAGATAATDVAANAAAQEALKQTAMQTASMGAANTGLGAAQGLLSTGVGPVANGAEYATLLGKPATALDALRYGGGAPQGVMGSLKNWAGAGAGNGMTMGKAQLGMAGVQMMQPSQVPPPPPPPPPQQAQEAPPPPGGFGYQSGGLLGLTPEQIAELKRRGLI